MRFNSLLNQIKQEGRNIIFVSTVFLIALGSPIFYGFFYAYPYMNQIPREIPVAVIDYDKTGMSREFLQMLDSTPNIRIASRPQSTEEALSLFSEWKAFALIVIPEKFQSNILRGEPATISYHSDGSYLIYYSQTYAAVQAVAATMSAGIKISRLESLGVPASAASAGYSSVSINTYGLFNPTSGYATYVMAGVFMLIMHQLTLVMISMSMVSAYSKGVTPVAKPFTELWAKVFVFMFILVMQTLFMFGIVLPLFNIAFFGKIFDLILFLFPFYLAVIFLGITLGSLFKNPETTVIYIAVTSIPLLFISGFSWPVYQLPGFLQVIRLIFPTSHGVAGMVRIYREGATISNVHENVVALWILAFVFFFTALYRLRVLAKKRASQG